MRYKKWVLGVDFTKVLHAVFGLEDPKSAKWHLWVDCLFAFLVFAHIKAAHKHVGGIDPSSLLNICSKYCIIIPIL